MERDMRCAVVGSVTAIGFCPIAAALTAVVYRFPAFMVGYVSGLSAVWPAMFSAIFYLVFGGFAVMGGLGAAAGIAVERLRRERAIMYTIGASFVIALLGALSLALLEYVVGPW
ncbi:hypothetical protein BKG82_16720 [Mycobacteroides chelonae]|uniref:Uncharacterized protein n=2 Tax=Mycobacteriaceae TaxID=1762 RepID=A0A1S1LLM2_MYCCH|nr:hypothetical protein AOT87_18465 [Mycobacteroides sp. H003]KRQ31000.1 hypothetical protein AOT91_13670 [Mycobacteroides sp. H092]KRQ43151.1 hypothetical protein AOT92_09315 [Mycobacteroides sp. H101]KRQ52746.1 hypothetical protein AOT88_02525 [Mycobacteroides sp. H063]KRQ59431.1 hypothetical protein AOT94_09450 [Mycobacteroides sp. HXVII]KRQ64315.1 hypothetical protein AOT90_10520 [Mycobacteroides sp. H079]KRQ74193.1 hypothetical protein AOT89_05410 [Mycobacteroides sp. H070]KRQ80709.1 hy